MYAPSQNDVRTFFCHTYTKIQEGRPLTPLESQAAPWINQHPEYAKDLSHLEAALETARHLDDGHHNPFLHLSMHLSLSEQISMDQPSGIRQAMERLAARKGSLHEAHHEAMECLGAMLWASQQSGLPPDGQAYLDAVRQRAGQ